MLQLLVNVLIIEKKLNIFIGERLLLNAKDRTDLSNFLCLRNKNFHLEHNSIQDFFLQKNS